MPWCPKCRMEYRQGVNTCTDCESELVPKLENIVEDNDYIDDKEAFLVTTSNSLEAEIIESILNTNKIPVLKKYREAGDYLKVYMGGTNFGVDLYVPSKLLEKAKDSIRGMQESNLDEAQQANDDEEQLYINKEAQQDFNKEVQQSSKKRSLSGWVIILYITPVLLWIVVYVLIKLYR